MQDILSSFRPGLFTDKRVLVSGGSSGIGLAVAQGFSSLGADVTATGTSAQKLAAAVADPANAKIRFETLDVRDRTAVDGFIAGLDGLDYSALHRLTAAQPSSAKR